MGWFWGSSDSDDEKKSQDPLRGLDPTLREFLAKESPVKYSTSNPDTTQQPPRTSHAIPSSENDPADALTSSAKPSKPDVPAESLFKDGRYAHLWKTYQPLAEVEAAAKTDQEKINDVLEGYKYRKAEIGIAALENCALEQWKVNECFENGGIAARLTMCRPQNREFERCYMMQAKFLKALGYLSTFDRVREVDEQIQMHADTLYHRMLDQEKQIEAAKSEGRPIPTFPPILSSSVETQAASTPDSIKTKITDLSPSVQAGLNKRLDGLNDEERELEERAIKAEIQAGEQVGERLGKIYEKQAEERRKRKEQGKETIADRVYSIFGTR